MKQYQFSIARNGQISAVFCTAPTVETAQRAVHDAYGAEYVIKATPVATFNAHRYYCEIDASK